MKSASILPKPPKSCVWLQFIHQTIPMEEVLMSDVASGIQGSPITFGFLEDKFEIHIFKQEISHIKVAVYRYRINQNKKHDDGYALRFYTIVTGFDEEPQASIMNHDDEEAEPVSSFKLSESVVAKINSSHYVFDIFVVAEMLEMKNIAEENEKKNKEKYLTYFLGPKLAEKELRDLCFILKCSALEEAFTGRLPKSYMDDIFYIIAFMAKNYSKVAAYLKARNKGKDSKNLTADLSSILKYVTLEDDEQGPLPFEEACEKYRLAHKIGFDYMKAIASDYLLSFIDEDSDNILNILEEALSVHDEELFEKAVLSFLKNFYKVTCSKKFKFYSFQKAAITRLIIHSARIWFTKNNVYIPGWKLLRN